jgi:cell division septation protein DedD
VGMLMKGACMKDGAAYCFSNANFTAMFASKTSSLSFDANGFALLCEPKSTPQRCMQQAFHQIYRPILVAGLSNSSRETLESIIEDICFTPDGVTPCSSITPNEGMVRSCLANYTGNITCCKSFVFQWLKKVDNFTKSNPVLAADLFGANNAQLVSSGVAALSNCSNFTTCSAPTATQVVSFKLNGVSMANIEKNRAKYTDAVKRDVISTGVSPATIKKIDFTAATAGHRFQVLADAVTVSVTFQGYGNQANAAKVAFETTASSSAWVPASLVEQYSEENPGAQITVVKSTPTPPSPPPTAPPTPTAPTTPSKPPSPPLSPGKSAALTNSLAPSMLIVFALAALMLAA